MRRRRNAGDGRPEAQLLKTPGIELTSRAQAMRLLKLSHGLGGGLVPFAVWLSRVRTALRERLLDLRNAFGSRGLLAAFPPFVSRRRSFV